ncbi:MAG: RHS domain-containing protein [Gammaproteobacteria bacterium]|nr:RHS domain-containing protein [Gammaproteobacteria bacterium]
MLTTDDLLLTQANGFTIDRNVQHGLPDAITNNHYQQQRSYNAYGEPSSVITQVANNAAYSYTLTYNDLSLIVGKSEALHDGSTHQYVYTYDDNRRLKSVMKDSVLAEAYSYDHNGNRTTQTNTARGIASQTASYNIADQLTQDGNVTYQYDVDGYLTQKTDGNDITRYTYSRQGRLLSVQTPTDLIEYGHNAMGNRVAKSVNGQTTEKYLWLDKTTLLATYDANNNLKQRFEYTLGHAPTSFMQNGNRYYIATDHLGSPRAISDESGNIVKAIAYDSYGNVTSDSNPAFTIPFGFAGGLQDMDTRLIRFGFRDYDPQTGRWTARDPIGLSGGVNVYGYVLGNPLMRVDISGLWPLGLPGKSDALENGPAWVKYYVPCAGDAEAAQITKEAVGALGWKDVKKGISKFGKDFQPPKPDELRNLTESQKEFMRDFIDKLNLSDEAKKELKDLLDPPEPSEPPKVCD